MAKKRTFTPEFKLQVVLEALSGAKSNAEICREHQGPPSPTAVSSPFRGFVSPGGAWQHERDGFARELSYDRSPAPFSRYAT